MSTGVNTYWQVQCCSNGLRIFMHVQPWRTSVGHALGMGRSTFTCSVWVNWAHRLSSCCKWVLKKKKLDGCTWILNVPLLERVICTFLCSEIRPVVAAPTNAPRRTFSDDRKMGRRMAPPVRPPTMADENILQPTISPNQKQFLKNNRKSTTL